jgi:hypothetical protein
MKLFYSLFYLVKEMVRSSRVLNYFYLVLFFNDRRIKNENIAVVGFPRVGNTYTGRVIKLGGNNRRFKFVHHYHSAAQAINSSNLNIPTLLVIRDPVDTILSLHIHSPKGKYYISAHILRFIIYHTRILLSPISNTLVINFNDFKDNPIDIIKKTNDKFNLKLNENISDLHESVINSILKDNKKNPANVLKVSAPSKKKEVLKNKYRSEVELNPLIIIANYLHQKLLKKTNG